MTDVLITGGRIVTAVDNYIADLLIGDGKIEAIGRELTASSAVKHDATGLLVMPGGVDVHTHMEFTLGAAETCDTFETVPNGAPGVEFRLPLLYDGGVRTGKISLNRFVQLVSTTPAKMFGLFPRKGTILKNAVIVG